MSLLKVYEAETVYKSCVIAANEKHAQLLQVKTEVLQQIREMILESDDLMKSATISYFQLQHLLTSPWGNQFQLLCDQSLGYEPGSRYMELVKQLPMPALQKDSSHSPFSFEQSLGDHPYESFHGNVEGKWPAATSDTDSIASSHSYKSREPSPSSSPKSSPRKVMQPALAEDDPEMSPDGGHMYWPSRSHPVSRASETHQFRVLMTPSRCRECDSYVYFYGVDCSQCGLACHKKCLGTLAIQCGHKRLPRKMTTFGIDLGQHLTDTSAMVPHIVCKCVDEVDLRGKHSMGIYRVSGVKSKVEKLCQAFENGADLVDLTDINPNVVSNVLKLYLRQLPEPLITHSLYPEFIRIAKEFPSNSTSLDSSIGELKEAAKKLPKHHYLTLALLILHLKRIANESAINRMPASNLGIVFGPTLLRTMDDCDTLNSLVDTIHQTRAVELMIANAEIIFNAEEVERAREFGSKWVKPVQSEHRTFSFRDHGKKKESPDSTKTEGSTENAAVVKPWVENLASKSGSKDGLDEDLSCFLATNSIDASPNNPMPKIFKGSLKDYQGLEGVSLVMLGSEPKSPSRKSSVKDRSLSDELSRSDSSGDQAKTGDGEVSTSSSWNMEQKKELEQCSYKTAHANIADAGHESGYKEVAFASNKARIVRQAWATQPVASEERLGLLQTAISSVVSYTGAIQRSIQHTTTIHVAGRETVVPVLVEDNHDCAA